MERRPLAGVLPVVQTPFDDHGRVDLDALERELDWVLDQGVAGLTTGMVSEVLRLTESERRDVGRVVTTTARGRGALSVLSCGGESTAQAVRYAREAEDLGADAAMVIPPTTVAVDDDAIVEYFTGVASSCSMALVVQDASGYVGRPMSIEVQARLHRELGERVYFKPEAPPLGQRLTALRLATDSAARTFEGTGGVNLVDGFHRGVVGSMPGAEVCWAVESMWRALHTGDQDRAYRINAYLALLINLQTSLDSYVAVEKYLLWRQDVLENTNVRGPVGFSLDPDTTAEIDRLLDLLRRATYA